MSIFLSHGDKGGCGKTVTCLAMIDWLVLMATDRPQPLIIDADPRNPDISRDVQNYLEAARLDLREHTDWMDLLDIVHRDPKRNIAINLPAGIGTAMGREAPHFLETVKKELQVPVHMFFTIDRGRDSVNLFKISMEHMLRYLTTVAVVRNLYFGSAENFKRWNDDPERPGFEARGVKTIDLPRASLI